MNIQETWDKAVKNTEILRGRMPHLPAFKDAKIPYIFLSKSLVNKGDTVIRKGEILVKRPRLHIPISRPQFDGFDFDAENEFSEDSLINFFLVRGIHLPSYKYDNKTQKLDVLPKSLDKTIGQHLDMLQKKEDVTSGLITAPDDCWQFALLIYTCTQVAKSANSDIKKLFERDYN